MNDKLATYKMLSDLERTIEIKVSNLSDYLKAQGYKGDYTFYIPPIFRDIIGMRSDDLGLLSTAYMAHDRYRELHGNDFFDIVVSSYVYEILLIYIEFCLYLNDCKISYHDAIYWFTYNCELIKFG